jgi:Ca-activated chloride channel family protein
MDYVFVADVSGSMKDEGKLDLSRGSLGSFVKALGAEDRFDIVTFNIQTKCLFGKLTAGGDASARSAEEFLASQEARGGTVLKPAVEAAYRYADPSRPLNVVILSDGLTEQGERAKLVEIIRSRPSKARVFCIGFGNDVNRGLLEQMAEESGGLAAFLSREDNLARQAHAFRRKLLRPVATDLKVEFGGIQVHDVEPQRLPNLYHGTPVRLYGRYKDSGAVTIHLKAKVGETPIERTLEIPFPEEDGSSPEIERMWATKRVDRLLKEADAGGPAMVDEIVRLGELYSITSQYTSFLVLENDQEFKRWKIERRNVLRISRDRASQEELAAQLDAVRSKAQAGLGPSAVPAETATPAISVASNSAAGTPAAPAGSPAGSPSPDRPRSRSLDFRIGGGAFDPISVGVAVGLAALGFAARRKMRRPVAAEREKDTGA